MPIAPPPRRARARPSPCRTRRAWPRSRAWTPRVAAARSRCCPAARRRRRGPGGAGTTGREPGGGKGPDGLSSRWEAPQSRAASAPVQTSATPHAASQSGGGGGGSLTYSGANTSTSDCSCRLRASWVACGPVMPVPPSLRLCRRATLPGSATTCVGGKGRARQTGAWGKGRAALSEPFALPAPSRSAAAPHLPRAVVRQRHLPALRRLLQRLRHALTLRAVEPQPASACGGGPVRGRGVDAALMEAAAAAVAYQIVRRLDRGAPRRRGRRAAAALGQQRAAAGAAVDAAGVWEWWGAAGR
jgi:hypothetical protein